MEALKRKSPIDGKRFLRFKEIHLPEGKLPSVLKIDAKGPLPDGLFLPYDAHLEIISGKSLEIKGRDLLLHTKGAPTLSMLGIGEFRRVLNHLQKVKEREDVIKELPKLVDYNVSLINLTYDNDLKQNVTVADSLTDMTVSLGLEIMGDSSQNIKNQIIEALYLLQDAYNLVVLTSLYNETENLRLIERLIKEKPFADVELVLTPVKVQKRKEKLTGLFNELSHEAQLEMLKEGLREKFESASEENLRTWDTLGGLDKLKPKIEELVNIITSPNLRENLKHLKEGYWKDKILRIVLGFFGPPGTGKTLAAEAFISELNRKTDGDVHFLLLSPADIKSVWHGHTEKTVKALEEVLNEKAQELSFNDWMVVVIDEAETLFRPRNLLNEISTSVVGQFLQMLSGISNKDLRGNVIFILISNHPEQLDPAIVSRIKYKLEFDFPTQEELVNVFKIILNSFIKDLEVEIKVSEDDLIEVSEKAVLQLNGKQISGRDVESIVQHGMLEMLAHEDLSQGLTKEMIEKYLLESAKEYEKFETKESFKLLFDDLGTI